MLVMNPIKWLRARIYGPRAPDHLSGPSEELGQTARDLRRALQPYLNRPDPLAALMTDLFNKRAMEESKGNGQHDWF